MVMVHVAIISFGMNRELTVNSLMAVKIWIISLSCVKSCWSVWGCEYQRKATCDKDSLPAFWECDWIIVEGRIDGRSALRFGISESAEKFTYPPSLNISHGLCWQNVQPTPIVAPKCWKSA